MRVMGEFKTSNPIPLEGSAPNPNPSLHSHSNNSQYFGSRSLVLFSQAYLFGQPLPTNRLNSCNRKAARYITWQRKQARS
jgi:hypothetical protein